MTLYPSDIYITWSYFESHHGKGPVDGVGGRVKSTVYRLVKSGRVVITSPEQFTDFANRHIDGIYVKFISEQDVNAELPNLNNVPEIPGTRKIHQVKRQSINGNNDLNCYYNSQFQPQSCDNPFCTQLYLKDVSIHVVNNTTQNAILRPLNAADDASLHDFVCVIYGGKWWIGTVLNTSVLNSDIQVSFLHPSGPMTIFHWPERKPDTCWIKLQDTIGRLLPGSSPTFTGTRNLCILSSVMNAIEDLFLAAQ